MLNTLYAKCSKLHAGVYPREQLLWPATGGSASSTSVENLLQISLFLTNKPNVKIGKISLCVVTIKNYNDEQRKMNSQRHKNKANPNPIQTQTKPILSQNGPYQSRFKPKFYPRFQLTLLWSLPSGVLTLCSAEGQGQTQSSLPSSVVDNQLNTEIIRTKIRSRK
jgi:hypothetical protein